MFKRMIRLSVSLAATVVMFCAFTCPSIGQASGSLILDQAIKGLHCENVYLHECLSNMASKYRVPIGLEIATSQSDKSSGRVNINIDNGTVRDILNAVVKADSSYSWEVKNGVVNVYPVQSRDEILNVQIKDFTADLKESGIKIRQMIFELPEIKAKLESLRLQPVVLFTSPIDLRSLSKKPVTISLKNTSLKDVLNEIAKNSDHPYWVISRYEDKQRAIIINF